MSGLRYLAIAALTVALPSLALADVAGVWSGVVRDSQQPLEVEVEMASKDGRVTGTIDVAQFGFLQVPLRDGKLDGDRVEWGSDVGFFTGAVSGDTIRGTWDAQGHTAGFEITRTVDAVLYQITTENVTFANGDVTLAGTLYLPEGAHGVPGVVLIHGSGKETREGHEKYAKYFARHGIAALAYDKRGVGKSTGDENAWRRFDFDDLAGDAVAGVEILARREEVNGSGVGVLGESQGGWVAPLAAAQSGAVAWVIGLSASVCTVAEDRLFERAARLKKEGFTDDEIALVTKMQRVDQELTRTGEGFETFAALWRKHENERWFSRVYRGDAPVAADHEWRLWYRTVLDFDPQPVIKAVPKPSLWLFGEASLDRFGPVEQSMANLKALRASRVPCAFRSFPDADHSLSVEAGWPGRIWAAESLPLLVSWISETATP